MDHSYSPQFQAKARAKTVLFLNQNQNQTKKAKSLFSNNYLFQWILDHNLIRL